MKPNVGRALVLDLLENNGGCRLPCWWGITPGQTSWKEAEAFFLQFDPQIWFNPPFAEVEIPDDVDFYRDLNQIGIRFTLQENRIVSMEVSGLKDSPYSLQEFLNAYGKPEEIWIKTLARDVNPQIPFVVALFYPKDGFTATYSTGDAQRDYEGSVIHACLEREPVLYLWNPQEKITFKEFGDLFEWDLNQWEPYLPLADATDMDVDTFYQRFKDTQDPVCLETPAELWPDPFAP